MKINHRLLTIVISILCTLHIFEWEMHSKDKNGKWYVKTAIHLHQLLQDKNECLVCTKEEKNKKDGQKKYTARHMSYME